MKSTLFLSELLGASFHAILGRRLDTETEGLQHVTCAPAPLRPCALSSSKEEAARGPCDAGSRWSQVVLTLSDVARASKS